MKRQSATRLFEIFVQDICDCDTLHAQPHQEVSAISALLMIALNLVIKAVSVHLRVNPM